MNNVFFIDDEKNILTSLERAFKSSNFKSHFFISGNEAINQLKDIKPDVIVCDVLMPEMNGFEVLKHFRELSPTTVPVMLTGYADVTTILHSMNSGEVYRFITKPWKNREEAEKIILDSIKYSEFLRFSSTS